MAAPKADQLCAVNAKVGCLSESKSAMLAYPEKLANVGRINYYPNLTRTARLISNPSLEPDTYEQIGFN